jgi:preprotein translocase subunit SecE
VLSLPDPQNAMFATTKNFFSEVKVELQKASWPWDPKERGMKKYKELVDSTVIVLIATLLMGGYVAGWDFILNLILGFLFRTPTAPLA